MDKIQKALRSLSSSELKAVKNILTRISSGNFAGLDLCKLSGYDGLFRVRKGNIRIIYQASPKGETSILAISRRNENTYKI